MRLLCLISLFILFTIIYGNNLEKYREPREQCERTPSSSDCVRLKSKFLEVLKKCQKNTTQQQALVCQEINIKLCAVFPSTCGQIITTKPISSTKSAKSTKGKPIITTTTEKPKPAVKPKPVITTTTTTGKSIISTAQTKVITANETISHEEFVKVPINPDELRTRGDYCVRHGKEKKCQELLTNLKNTYSTCGKKKSEPQPEHIDCHSFQTHLCKAFPKFPPCLKKPST